jgi:hypothetical protein
MTTTSSKALTYMDSLTIGAKDYIINIDDYFSENGL